MNDSVGRVHEVTESISRPWLRTKEEKERRGKFASLINAAACSDPCLPNIVERCFEREREREGGRKERATELAPRVNVSLAEMRISFTLVTKRNTPVAYRVKRRGREIALRIIRRTSIEPCSLRDSRARLHLRGTYRASSRETEKEGGGAGGRESERVGF